MVAALGNVDFQFFTRLVDVFCECGLFLGDGFAHDRAEQQFLGRDIEVAAQQHPHFAVGQTQYH